MSVIATRMTFVDPKMIEPMMDAIADGWQLGRRSSSIQYVKWEQLLELPLEDVRSQLGVAPSGFAARPPLAA